MFFANVFEVLCVVTNILLKANLFTPNSFLLTKIWKDTYRVVEFCLLKNVKMSSGAENIINIVLRQYIAVCLNMFW